MQAGYPKYKDVLTKSMKELGYSNTEIPSEISADKCMIRMRFVL